MKRMMSLMLLVLPLLGFAADVDGVKLDDSAVVAGQKLNLAGAGVRSKWGIAKVYVGALYTVAKPTNADSVIGDSTNPRRVTLTMMRHVDGDRFRESLIDGLEANATEGELSKLGSQIKEMEAYFAQLKEVNEGDLVTLDFMPGKGTQVTARGQTRLIGGDDFARAMLRIWVGKQPVSNSLKSAMLGLK
ncbi:chalcone isomerase family protein [Burkholderiaceae bacterium DAT-1]|nr:chalcone isomerase family protein [Burkholderiaceae bacterium DAT-1]